MKLKSVILILLSAIVSSCGSPSVSRQLDLAESLLDERPDSALYVIRSIDTLSLSSRSMRAKYSLLHAAALDKNYIDTTDVGIIGPAVEYYIKHGVSYEKFKTCYYLGRIQYNAGDLNAAAVSFSKAESIDAEIADNQAKGLLYMAFADVYNKTRNKEKETEYVERGIAAFEEAGDIRHSNLSAGRLAILYYGKREWDKADSLFSAGIELAREDTVAMSVFLSNYARMKVVQPDQDPKGAISLLNTLHSSYKCKLSLTDYGVLAYASALSGDDETCDRIAAQLKALKSPYKDKVLYWLYRIEQSRGNYEAALEYNIASNTNNLDAIDNLLSDSVGQALQHYFFLESENSRHEAHIVKLKLSLVFLGISLLLVVVIVFLKFRQNKREKEFSRMLRVWEETSNLLRQSNSDLQQELSMLKSRAGELEQILANLRRDFVSTYKDKFSVIGQLCDAYVNYDRHFDKKDFVLREVEGIIKNISDDDKLHARFEEQINRDLNNIVTHIKDDLGIVDKVERRFVCYCIVGFNPDMIGSILGLSIQNVYTKKSRLKDRIRQLDSPYKDEYLRML